MNSHRQCQARLDDESHDRELRRPDQNAQQAADDEGKRRFRHGKKRHERLKVKSQPHPVLGDAGSQVKVAILVPNILKRQPIGFQRCFEQGDGDAGDESHRKKRHLESDIEE